MEKQTETTEKIINKIRDLRKEKGYSLESMADDLKISTSAYNKIERMESALTVDRLIKIKKILDVPYSEFFDTTVKNIYNQDFKDNSKGYFEVQNLYQENRDIYERLITSKNEQIAAKDKQIELLERMLEMK